MRPAPARLFYLRGEFDDRQGNIKTQLSFSGRFWQSGNIKQRQETSSSHLFGQIVVGLLEPFERERFEPLLVEKHCLHSVRLEQGAQAAAALAPPTQRDHPRTNSINHPGTLGEGRKRLPLLA